MAERGEEHTRSLVVARPGDGLVRRVLRVLRDLLRVDAGAVEQDGGGPVERHDVVEPRPGGKRCDTPQDRMLAVLGVDGHLGRGLVAVVGDPLLAEHVTPEAVVERGVRAALRVRECVRARAQADDRLSGIDVLQHAGELIVGQRAESREHDHQVGGLERLESLDVGLGLRNRLRDGDRRAHPVRLLQDRRDHRHRDLGSVLVVSGHEHHMWRPDLGGDEPRPVRGEQTDDDDNAGQRECVRHPDS